MVGERYHRVHFETLRIFCFVLGFEVLCVDAWKLLDYESFLFDQALWLKRVRQAVIVFDASSQVLGGGVTGNCLMFLSYYHVDRAIELIELHQPPSWCVCVPYRTVGDLTFLRC